MFRVRALSRQSGFTLIELLIGLVISSVLLASLALLLNSALTSYARAKDQLPLYRPSRQCRLQLEHDLRNAIPHEFIAFTGAETEASWPAYTQSRLEEVRSAPLNITWQLEGNSLMRLEKRLPLDRFDEAVHKKVMWRGLKSFSLSYAYRDEASSLIQFLPDWGGDIAAGLPYAVRVSFKWLQGSTEHEQTHIMTLPQGLIPPRPSGSL